MTDEPRISAPDSSVHLMLVFLLLMTGCVSQRSRSNDRRIDAIETKLETHNDI